MLKIQEDSAAAAAQADTEAELKRFKENLKTYVIGGVHITPEEAQHVSNVLAVRGDKDDKDTIIGWILEYRQDMEENKTRKTKMLNFMKPMKTLKTT